jgi:hypothetical protein
MMPASRPVCSAEYNAEYNARRRDRRNGIAGKAQQPFQIATTDTRYVT